MNLSDKQLKRLSLHAKEAVESLPIDHPYIHLLGSLPYLCEDLDSTYKELEELRGKVRRFIELHDLLASIPKFSASSEDTISYTEVAINKAVKLDELRAAVEKLAIVPK